MAGRLVLVVGPSGAGKDSLLDGARVALARDSQFVFQRRDITRPADAGGEAHRAVTIDAFDSLKAASGYALDWRAHGLAYGIPIAINELMDAGKVVIVNGSRGVIAMARERYPNLAVIEVTAPPAVLAQRLAARGREDADSIQQRLERSGSGVDDHPSVFRISNDRDLATGISTLVSALHALAA
jgi:phosphonate metabolism protein PhnN/1,5-bisphosphokinase (PRPP-forming)